MVKWVQRIRKTDSVEANSMRGHPLAKLLPHENHLLQLVAEEPNRTLRRNRIRLRKDRPRRGTEPSQRQEAA